MAEAPTSVEKPRTVEQPTRVLTAVEPGALVIPREEAKPAAKNHTVLWIIAGVAVAGALGAGGYFLWQGSRTPSSATINATWSH
jgi:hypothetical protein